MTLRVRLLAGLLLFLAASVGAREVLVRYHRPDGDYAGWTLWTWNPETNQSREIQPREDPFGVAFSIDPDAYGPNAARLGMLPKFRNWEGKDDPDRFWTPTLGDNAYILSGAGGLTSAPPDVSPRIIRAYVDGPDRIRLVLSKSLLMEEINTGSASIRESSGAYAPVRNVSPVSPANGRAKILLVELSAPVPTERLLGGKALYGAFRPGDLEPGRILDGYFDTGPLGARYTPARTTFRTFAPTARRVAVLLYARASGGESRAVEMTRQANGIWQARVAGNLAGQYYTFLASQAEGDFEVLDPYSRSNTATTVGLGGRGLIFADRTRVAPPPSFPPSDAIIYEMHIRDFTFDPEGGIRARGKYLGLTERGTRLAGDSSIATGLDHLRELGVNVVQIMPIQDFDNREERADYNWGYMPYHFFSPDGWYATRRDDATRVAETKRMIDALHRAGMKVVLDVVYNHTAEGNPAARVSFNGLAPNYYYRVKEDGTYWNGSGCGNEFRTESPMGRRFLVESLVYWVREMGVDGFRFDLLGLIDLETIRQGVAAVRAVKPDALIYGEPWAGGTTGVTVTGTGSQRGQGFGVFNAEFRDALRGGVFGQDPGWLTDGRDVEKVKRGIMGEIGNFAQVPTEAINYIEAHDNHTLWDRFALVTRNRTDLSRDDLVRMDRLGAAILLTSQGIPFIHSGQEFLRTKNGEDNTYNASDDVNEIHWRAKRENRAVFDYYKGLVRLRRNHPMFRLATAEEIHRSLFFLDDHLGLPVPPRAVGYVLNRGTTRDSWHNALVLFNPNAEPADFQVPPGAWTPVVNADTAGEAALGPPATGGRVRVGPRAPMIFFNNDPAFFDAHLRPRLASKVPQSIPFAVQAPAARRVTLAGSFNGWNQDATVLRRDPDGWWRTEVSLLPGTYEYKFLADGNWDALNPGNRTLTVP